MAREPVVPPRPPCALYLITPPAIPDLPAFAKTLGDALDAGAVAALQIRLKDVDDATVLAAVEAMSMVVPATIPPGAVVVVPVFAMLTAPVVALAVRLTLPVLVT